jgi:hypothetical protein
MAHASEARPRTHRKEGRGGEQSDDAYMKATESKVVGYAYPPELLYDIRGE